jgi:hypothetical protein
METEDNPFAILEGRQLSAVTFVQDYLQILFDGPRITAYTLPEIRVNEKSYKWGDSGYRDFICDLIGHKVDGTKLSENEELSIHFMDGRELAISLKPEDYVVAEAMMLEDDQSNLWVW